jgi:hypothetical protein
MKQSFVCELTTANVKYKTDSTLILPLKNSRDQIIAILEVKMFILLQNLDQ